MGTKRRWISDRMFAWLAVAGLQPKRRTLKGTNAKFREHEIIQQFVSVTNHATMINTYYFENVEIDYYLRQHQNS